MYNAGVMHCPLKRQMLRLSIRSPYHTALPSVVMRSLGDESIWHSNMELAWPNPSSRVTTNERPIIYQMTIGEDFLCFPLFRKVFNTNLSNWLNAMDIHLCILPTLKPATSSTH